MATPVYYTYRHHAGYGRDDHCADEWIARAARYLGADTGHLIAQHVGLASHPVPLHSLDIRLRAAPGVRQRMERALRLARAEFRSGPDCWVYVACERTVRVSGGAIYDGCYYPRAVTLTQTRRGSRWVTDTIEEEGR